MFALVQNTEEYNAVKQWIIKHIEKFRYIYDFSGLAFGVIINERKEKIQIMFPLYIRDEERSLYPEYDEMSFKALDIIAKLEWMYENCEFMPFCVEHEYIDLGSDSKSYKYSHIKRDHQSMRMLDSYISGLKHLPKDDVYYFIGFNVKTSVWYLRRDLKKSPKHK